MSAPAARSSARRPRTSPAVPVTPIASIRAPASPRAAARRAAAARVGPQHTGSVVDSRTPAGSRPDCSQIRRKFANRAASPSGMPLLNSSANRAASAGVRRGPAPPMMTGGRRAGRGTLAHSSSR